MEAAEGGNLDITVARYERVAACPSFTDDQVARLQLTDGFPFLVDRASGQIIEPVFRYLYARAIKNAPKLSTQSAVAAADNLRLWWGYLRYRGRAWDQVTGLDIDGYRNGLSRALSPKTGKRLATGTLRQRVTHLLEFYRWTNRQRMTAIAWRSLGSDENQVVGDDTAPDVRALTYEEWAKVRLLVGPLPSDAIHHPIEAPSRDRLSWELMIHTGMRLKEVCGLTVHQFRALAAKMPSDLGLFGAGSTRLTIVKGGPKRARDAIVPNWLVQEVIAYADGAERRVAAQSYASRHRGREPDALFLNHAFARREPGAPLKPKRVEAHLNAVMRQAGLVETVRVTDPDTGEVHLREQALHSVHDLRHTAAVWRYMAERAAGNPDPWRPVMVMLGHVDEKTTKQIYLQITNLFEAAVSDAALRFFRGLQPGAQTDGDEGAL